MALFAFALFPAFAQADSGELQYSDAPPTATGGKEPSGRKAPAKSSSSSSGGASAPSSTADSADSGPSDGSSSSDDASGGSGGGGAGDKGGGDGGTGQGSRDDAASGVSGSPAQSPAQTVAPSASTEDDGGSSPLVPILVAILALAAISFGAMMLKQRRRKDTSAARVSPKAS